jgi:raffinose/stachyose/melibiose transport system substrate-binding protein
MKKNFSKTALLAGCAALVLFSACQKKGAASDGKVHLSLWHTYVGADQRAKFMVNRMEQFLAQNPDIAIEEQKIPRDQYTTRLKTQAAAKELPNVFVSWPNMQAREYIEAGLLSDINDLLAREKAWSDAILPIAKDQFTVDGKTYSVGMGVSVTSLFFYNKDLFKKYNVKVPTTYDELKTAIKTFKAQGIIPLALGNKARWPAQSEMISIIGSLVTGDPWLFDAIAGRNGAKFTDDIFISALNIMKELADMEAFNSDYNSIDDVQVRGYFYREEAAMMINGTWVITDMIDNLSDEMKDKIEIITFPMIAGGKGTPESFSGVSSTGLVINAQNTPEQKAAAEKLIFFLTNDDAQKMYMDYYIPVSSKTVEPDLSNTDKIYAKLVTAMKAHPNMVTVYDSALTSEQTEIINNGLQSIMLGLETPKQVAEELAATVN